MECRLCLTEGRPARTVACTSARSSVGLVLPRQIHLKQLLRPPAFGSVCREPQLQEALPVLTRPQDAHGLGSPEPGVLGAGRRGRGVVLLAAAVTGQLPTVATT